MPVTIKEIIEKYYYDYTRCSFITKTEFEELLVLLEIITKKSINCVKPWTVQDARNALEGQKIIDLKETTSSAEKRIERFFQRQFSGDQRSQEWLKQRMNYITASVSATCAGLMGNSSREDQILGKATWGNYRPFKGGYYTDKGNIFEPVTNSYYCFKNNCVIYEFNLIPHENPEWAFLGASTDGVTNHLINIEIKTLVGRKLDPNKFKTEYYHQMQHQMECLNLSVTDFIEVQYDDGPDPVVLSYNDAYARGAIIECYDLKEDFYHYIYSDVSMQQGHQQWEQKQLEQVAQSINLVYLRTIYWAMTGYLCRRVEKDPEWLNVMGPKLKEFWNEVLALREDQQALKKRLREKNEATMKRKQKKKVVRGNIPEDLPCLL